MMLETFAAVRIHRLLRENLELTVVPTDKGNAMVTLIY